MMKRCKICVLGFAVLACALVGATEVKAQRQKDEVRVLFVGNSLTYANDLPPIGGALADAAKQPRFVYETVSFAHFSLQAHWWRGAGQNAITGDRWDIVVLQQGPSALAESGQRLRQYTSLFNKPIRAFKAR